MAHKRVRIIDAEDHIRETARIRPEVLAGWEASTSSSESEGTVIARDQQPGSILSGVMMPDMDGPAAFPVAFPVVFKELSGEEATGNIPVILLTGKERPTGQDGLGAPGVITKPFDPLNLPSDVSKIMGWPP